MNGSEVLRQDVKTIGLVALGGTVALYYVVSGICQTAAGFAVDRFGARPAMVFYTVVVTAILTIATVLNLPGRPAAAKAA